MTIKVQSGDDRESREEQILEILEGKRPHDAVKLRIPITIYDPKKKQYVQLRDAYYSLEIPPEYAQPQIIEDLVGKIGAGIMAAATPDVVQVGTEEPEGGEQP